MTTITTGTHAPQSAHNAKETVPTMTDPMTTPPLDLPALRARIERAKERPVPPGLAGILALDALALLDRVEDDRKSLHIALERAARNHARAEGLARELSASGGRNIDLLARAEAAEKKVAAVEALCKTTDGEWLDPEDECNNVGGILQALRGGA